MRAWPSLIRTRQLRAGSDSLEVRGSCRVGLIFLASIAAMDAKDGFTLVFCQSHRTDLISHNAGFIRMRVIAAPGCLLRAQGTASGESSFARLLHLCAK